MDWNLYWTIIWQIVLACVILTLPVGLTLLIWASAVRTDKQPKIINHFTSKENS